MKITGKKFLVVCLILKGQICYQSLYLTFWQRLCEKDWSISQNVNSLLLEEQKSCFPAPFGVFSPQIVVLRMNQHKLHNGSAEELLHGSVSHLSAIH